MVRTLIVIGSSTGGPKLLNMIFSSLPRLDAAVIVVQHVPRVFDRSIAERLDSLSPMRIALAEAGETLCPSRVYVAPAERHVSLTNNSTINLMSDGKINHVYPSIDVTMKSLKKSRGMRLIGVVLTGMGRDGADGIAHIKGLGGITIAQDESSSTIYGMPKAAFMTGCVDYVLHAESIPEKLIGLAGIIPG